jgi:ABC-type glycerol-3-phosphate transport system substrate-binding protein
MRAEWRLVGLIVASAAALVWAVPFAWMAVAALRPGVPADIATLTPPGPFALSNFREAWQSGNFPLWYLNTIIVCGGILAVQLVTVTAAGYAFARLGMMILSTGSLSFVRENMKTPYRVAFMPRNLRNAAPIGGASLILPKGNSAERQAAAWTLIGWLTSPEIAGEWSRLTGYFAPRKAAYDLPEMKDYLQQHPDAKVALDQLQYAVPWFDTYNTVAVRKAIEDQVQAILSGKTTPAQAVQAAQKNADELLRPYVEETALKRLA